MISSRDSISRSGRRSTVLIAAVWSTASLVLAVAGCQSRAKPQAGTRLPEVIVVVSKKLTMPIVVNPIGTTRALNDVTIRARVKGFLEEKHFEDGRNVKKGDLLLVIEEKPYQVRLELAKAELAAAQAAVKKAKASKANIVSQARLALDEAQLRLDEVEERREQILLSRKAVSQEDYDKAQAQRKKSAAQVDADRASLEQAEADYTIDIENAQAELARAQSSLDDAALNLTYCRVIAPIDGRIGELKVKRGNLVGDGSATELVTIQQLDPMGLDLRPAARYLPNATALVSKGIHVKVMVEGERLHPHTGATLFIDNQVDTETGTFLVRASVPNPDGALLPGQYVKATVVIGEYVDAVVVPEQAVVEGQEGARVFVVDAANKVQVQKVSAIDAYQGLRVLESGLDAGQRVIVEGIQLVRPGQSVKPIEAPLEKYQKTAPPTYNTDPRLNSKVSHVPGFDSLPPGGEPSAPRSGPEPRRAEPGAKKSPPDAEKAVPDTKAKPGASPATTPQKRGR
jgi:membrane fusion protein (multidrug efflux system)